MNRRHLLKGFAALSMLNALPLVIKPSLAKAAVQNILAPKQDLVIYIGAEPEDGFDPCTGWGFYGYMLFQSALLKLNKNIEITHDLANNYQISDDGLTYTFTLKKNILFSDGSPLSVNDVIFTYLTAKNSGSMVDLTMLESVSSHNDDTIIFKLNRPWSTFLYTIAQLGIVPEKHYHPHNYRLNPIGSGPFRMVQWDQGQQLIIEPNPYYNHLTNQTPNFKTITILFLEEDMAIAYAKSGLLDVVMVNPEYSQQPIKGMQLIRLPTVDNRGFNLPVIKEYKDINNQIIGNNVLNDKAIRQALNIGINRQLIIDNALNGIGTPAFSRVDQLPWSNPQCKFMDNRLEEAKQLLDQAGWIVNPQDGIRVKNGIKAAFNINARTDDLQRYNLAIALAQNAKQLGIEITARAKAWSQCKQLAKHEPCCWGSGDYNPQDLYYGYHTNGMYNYSSYSNSIVDNYIEQALSTTDNTSAIKFWQQSQWDGKTGPDSENGDHPFLWLVNIDHIYFARNGLNLGTQQLHPHGHGWPVVANLEEWSWDVNSRG